ncbi:MAG: hypothetical protein NC200_08165 [Candidatus Gastranaerophilales bacterium]|nr:hypothetical protein [Candidatus Gastranaerophilales bacterium]
MNIQHTYNYPSANSLSNGLFNKKAQKQNISFGCANDAFIRSCNKEVLSKGVQSINNVRQGFYGSVCDGSVPLKNFFYDFLSKDERLNVLARGLSTNKQGIANSYLKGSADKPFSTSCVFDCSVMYLFNKNTNTHLLYHAAPSTSLDEYDAVIKELMPEGFTHACISPGDSRYSFIHRYSLKTMFSSIKDSNRDAVVNVYHQSSRYPEIVGYKGKLFELPNINFIDQSFGRYGQASFNIQEHYFCK